MIWQSDININETETQCVNNTDPLPCSVNNPCNNGGTCMNGEESVANVLLCLLPLSILNYMFSIVKR